MGRVRRIFLDVRLLGSGETQSSSSVRKFNVHGSSDHRLDDGDVFLRKILDGAKIGLARRHHQSLHATASGGFRNVEIARTEISRDFIAMEAVSCGGENRTTVVGNQAIFSKGTDDTGRTQDFSVDFEFFGATSRY